VYMCLCVSVCVRVFVCVYVCVVMCVLRCVFICLRLCDLVDLVVVVVVVVVVVGGGGGGVFVVVVVVVCVCMCVCVVCICVCVFGCAGVGMRRHCVRLFVFYVRVYECILFLNATLFHLSVEAHMKFGKMRPKGERSFAYLLHGELKCHHL
jgi:hypothetical protein